MLNMISSCLSTLPITRPRATRGPQRQIGATAIEYALIAGLIAVVIIGGATLLGSDIDSMFRFIAEKIPTSE